ncbi:NAD(P)-dependent alcohol dehydrogenase [Lonepinella koalarum]|uniref:NAD(P)-dependent alcohol dehydrogenase n=1 Tax=Lonepinella koalarum TaxID=53417 RepID=UPI003F6E06B8
MSNKAKGYAAHSADSPLVPFEFERRDLRADDVQIEILYSGVCHSDLHTVHNDWGATQYPVVPGHEIVGRVIAVGDKVKNFKAGDVVGVGCMVDSCRECEPCHEHEEQFCENGVTMTYDSDDRHDGTRTYGGYSNQIIVSEAFVLRVPENLDLSAVPPILCAGVIVWSPLNLYKVGKGSKVAVVGLGGVGHMAVKIAAALGAEVTVLDIAASKEADAKRLGATHFVLSNDPEQLKTVANTFDLVLDIVPVKHDITPFVETLKLKGTLVIIGLIGLAPEFSTVPLMFGRRAVVGTMIGGTKETQEVLDFCGKHNVVSDVEIIKMSEINEAYVRMAKGDVKYRFVIDMQNSF